MAKGASGDSDGESLKLPRSSSRGGVRTIDPERLTAVEELLLKGKSPRHIVKTLAPVFGVTRRQVHTYVAIVRKRIGEVAATRDPMVDGEIAREMLLHAYEVAEIGGESGPMPSAMVQAARVYAEITGALKPAKVDITSGGKPLQSLTEDELRARVAERLAALESLRTRSA